MVLGGLDCTILPSNPLIPTLSKMRKDARRQAVLRDQRLLGWGVSPQHDAVFHDFIRQSNNSYVAITRCRKCHLQLTTD
jgi:hypothetical protein